MAAPCRAPASQRRVAVDRNFIKYLPLVLLVVIVAAMLIPRTSVVQVAGISAGPQKFGPPLVKATLVNEGDAIDVRYWVEIPGRSEQLCGGSIRLGDNERKALSFPCPGLKGHAGDFTLETGPAG